MAFRRYSILTAALVVAFINTFPAAAADSLDVATLELEELMEIEVTSVSRGKSSLADSPAAVMVLTNEDIRRSGATTIPELLRLVPGLQVARINTSTWAISSRGFTSATANKLLVMIDGRTVYNPAFSGTFWDTQDTLLEDVERIEVIRGPGGALWGANAVNGVINIITKDTAGTKGGYLLGGGGSWQELYSGARWGGAISETTTARVYAKGDKFKSGDPTGPVTPDEDWNRVQTGFRLDNTQGKVTSTLQGDMYSNRIDLDSQSLSLDSPSLSNRYQEQLDLSGGNVLGKVIYKQDSDSILSTQLYFDRINREFYQGGAHINTFDLDTQHQYRVAKDHEITYGFGARFIDDAYYTDNKAVTFEPSSENYQVFSSFIQDTISLIPDSLSVTLGTKLEHNDFSGYEVQPSARLLWKPRADYTFWSAISRAVRTPSRYDQDADFAVGGFPTSLGVPGIVRVEGNDGTDAEELMAYEIGQRYTVSKQLFVDLSLFINSYDRLIGLRSDGAEPGELDGYPVIWSTERAGNVADALTGGVELLVEAHPLPYWRLIAGYTYFDGSVDFDSEVLPSSRHFTEGQNARHIATLRSQLDLPYEIELDATGRYVDSLAGAPHDPVLLTPPGKYIELDLRVSKKLTKSLRLSVIGQNLLQESHREFSTTLLFGNESEVPRAVLGMLEYKF